MAIEILYIPMHIHVLSKGTQIGCKLSYEMFSCFL